MQPVGRSAGAVEHAKRDGDHGSDLAAQLLTGSLCLPGRQVYLLNAVAPHGDQGLVQLHAAAGGIKISR